MGSIYFYMFWRICEWHGRYYTSAWIINNSFKEKYLKEKEYFLCLNLSNNLCNAILKVTYILLILTSDVIFQKRETSTTTSSGYLFYFLIIKYAYNFYRVQKIQNEQLLIMLAKTNRYNFISWYLSECFLLWMSMELCWRSIAKKWTRKMSTLPTTLWSNR